MTCPDIVTYDGLPAASGGAHALRIRKPSAAHAKVRAFLDACTEPVGASALTFQLWAGGPGERTQRWQEIAAELLGGPRRTVRTHREWGVREDSVRAVLDALDAAGPEDVTQYSRSLACLVLNIPVRLVDAGTREPYAGVSTEDTAGFAVDGYGRTLGASGVRATIGSASCSLSLWLSFPGDDRLDAAAAQVRENAPVRLSAKHWRRWTPRRDGTGYRSVKIPSPDVR
ncbi:MULTISPECIES: hypothetical protein [Amycolatopsis]|uniref:Uncharacterized protein n=1 Tax=Amycolatopsis albidoflavus TaxID=102226 RepID=A0ABW5HYP4_9PSEU